MFLSQVGDAVLRPQIREGCQAYLISQSIVIQPPPSEMDIQKDFTKWAAARGVKANGIAVHRFPGKGLGIIAEKKLEVRGTNLGCLFMCGLCHGLDSFAHSALVHSLI